MKNNITFGWRTKKVGNKFNFVVTRGKSRTTPNKDGRYIDDKIIHAGTRNTRARASGVAKRYALFYRRKRDNKIF